MKEVIKYIVLVSVIGLLQLVITICAKKDVACYIWIVMNGGALLVFAGFYLYYRAIIDKYLSLNLRYLGDNYKQPFLVRSFLGKWLLAGKSDTFFSDFKALTTYKYLKLLQVLGGIFLGFSALSAAILIVKHIN